MILPAYLLKTPANFVHLFFHNRDVSTAYSHRILHLHRMKKRVCRIVCQNNYWKSDFVNFTLKSGLFWFFAAALTPRTPRGENFAKWVAFGLIFMVFSAVFSHRSTSPSSTRDQRTHTRQSYTHDSWTEAHMRMTRATLASITPPSASNAVACSPSRRRHPMTTCASAARERTQAHSALHVVANLPTCCGPLDGALDLRLARLSALDGGAGFWLWTVSRFYTCQMSLLPLCQ